MTNWITYRMSFKAQKDDSHTEWDRQAERLPDKSKDQMKEVSRLTPRGGPGRLNKSFWSSSWYFYVSWLQTETCCCQPKAQTLCSCCICSVCVHDCGHEISVCRSVCEQTLHSTQPDWTGVSVLETCSSGAPLEHPTKTAGHSLSPITAIVTA